ncbi:MAG: TorF family putative porin [Gallionella sp.]
MRTLLNTLILAALAVPSMAMAADAAPASPHTFTSNVGLVSNYLYRGISQTGAGPAIQGGFDYAHSSGFYAGVWGSSISWLSDAGVASTASVELDTYLGYKGTAGDVAYDVGFLRYNYPGTYVVGAVKGDTDEIYGAVTYSIVTAKYSHSLGDTFGVSNAQGTNYFDLSANYALPDTGVTLGAHYGKQTFKGSTAAAFALAGNSATYSDYKLSATKDFSGYVVGLAYSSTNATPFYTSPQLKQLGKGTAVLSLTRSF